MTAMNRPTEGPGGKAHGETDLLSPFKMLLDKVGSVYLINK